MPEFSLSLNADQQQLKDWIHEFAVDVICPAAHEWDEREEFPWPIVQEAAKIGLYGLDFIMNAMSTTTSLLEATTPLCSAQRTGAMVTAVIAATHRSF